MNSDHYNYLEQMKEILKEYPEGLTIMEVVKLINPYAKYRWPLIGDTLRNGINRLVKENRSPFERAKIDKIYHYTLKPNNDGNINNPR